MPKMRTTPSRLAGVLILLLGMMIAARPAEAVATVEIVVIGDQRAVQSTEIVLVGPDEETVKEDDRDRAAGLRRWRTLKNPGSYKVRVVRDGRVLERVVKVPESGTVRINVSNDGIIQLDTGSSQKAPSEKRDWSAGVFGGATWTPFDGRATADFGGGATSSASGSLDQTLPEIGVELRRTLEANKRIFVFAMLLAGLDSKTNNFGDFHPTPGRDTGIKIKEEAKVRLGVGTGMEVAPGVNVNVLAGVQGTLVNAWGFSDESGGGGLNERFGERRLLVAPYFALEGATSVGAPPLDLGNTAVELFIRGSAAYQPDFNFSGRSSLGFDYNFRVGGGLETGVEAGLRVGF